MKLYRISKSQYAGDLSGKGAESTGGRWNSKGKKAVYCAQSASLAVLETLAWTSLSILLSAGFVLTVFSCNEDNLTELSMAELPEDWNSVEAYPKTQKLGDQWLTESKSLLLRVPSAILPMESNMLINPLHPLIRNVRVEAMFDITIDQRVLENIQH